MFEFRWCGPTPNSWFPRLCLPGDHPGPRWKSQWCFVLGSHTASSLNSTSLYQGSQEAQAALSFQVVVTVPLFTWQISLPWLASYWTSPESFPSRHLLMSWTGDTPISLCRTFVQLDRYKHFSTDDLYKCPRSIHFPERKKTCRNHKVEGKVCAIRRSDIIYKL